MVNSPGDVLAYVVMPVAAVVVTVFAWPEVIERYRWLRLRYARRTPALPDGPAWDEHCRQALAAVTEVDPFVESPVSLPLSLADRMWLIEQGVTA
jgi:hypothetical protein